MLQTFSQYKGLSSFEGAGVWMAFLGTDWAGFKSALGFVWLLQLHLFLHRWTTRLPPSHTHLSNLRAPGQWGSEVPYCQHSTELGMRFLSAPRTYQTHSCWQAGCRVQSSALQNVQSGIFQMCSALHFIQGPSPIVRNGNRGKSLLLPTTKILAVNMHSSAPHAALGTPKLSLSAGGFEATKVCVTAAVSL